MGRSPDVVERAIVSDDDRALFKTFLTSARQRAGRSLEEIARTTKISPRYLQALEDGRPDVLPAGMYRRAILRNYATAVGLDPRVAVERFVQTFGSESASEPGRVAPATSSSRNALPRSVKTPSPTATWISDRSLMMPARWLASVAATMVVVFAVTFATRGNSSEPTSSVALPASEDEVRVSQSPAVSAKADAVPTPATPVVERDDEPSVGTGGRPPIERAQSPGETRPVESRLVVTSNPAGARVTVNGIAWGITPVTIRHLPPGAKTIRVTKDGYLGLERRVNIGEGRGASVELTLQPRS
jgi:hypothetical protein